MELAKLLMICIVAVSTTSSSSILQQNEILPENDGYLVLMPLQKDNVVLHSEDNTDQPMIPLFVLDTMEKDSKLRVRRQVSVDVGVNRDDNQGTSSLAANVKGNLWNNGPHRLDGNAHWSRNYGPQGAENPVYGGGIKYSHSDKASVALDVSRQRPFGTQVSAEAQGTLWRSRDGLASLSAKGHWSRSFGQWGASRPTYGGMVIFERKF